MLPNQRKCVICKAQLGGPRGQKVQPDMIPEFVRCVTEAAPTWFVMENVPRAPIPEVLGYTIKSHLVNANSFGSPQRRIRRFTWGSRGGREMWPEMLALFPPVKHGTVTTRNQVWDKLRQRPRSNSSASTWPAALEAQGLPADFLADAPFSSSGKWEMVGNGVPLPMGRAIARAVKEAIR